MNLVEGAPLSLRTTFRIGGKASVLAEVESDEEIRAVLALARARGLPVRILGAGSNLLVPDEGIDAFVIEPVARSITIEDADETALIIADAGARWDDVVDRVARAGLWGIENLAGIPGSAGGAAVQNIGAYGSELSETFAFAECLRIDTGETVRIAREEARFAYRTSLFKRDRRLLIARIALRVHKSGAPHLAYSDLARAKDAGEPLSSPREIAQAVRAIRARKFPGPGEEGTAGSFWKNPIIPADEVRALSARYPGLPVYALPENVAKVSLAWLLDHALSLKGYAQGPARLYEKQPLVVVAEDGASARDVETLVRDVAARVKAATGIDIEREVETFGA